VSELFLQNRAPTVALSSCLQQNFEKNRLRESDTLTPPISHVQQEEERRERRFKKIQGVSDFSLDNLGGLL
jgi:hypothetical protein